MISDHGKKATPYKIFIKKKFNRHNYLSNTLIYTYISKQPCGFSCCGIDNILDPSSTYYIPSPDILLSKFGYIKNTEHKFIILQSFFERIKNLKIKEKINNKYIIFNDRFSIDIQNVEPETAVYEEAIISNVLSFYKTHIKDIKIKYLSKITELEEYKDLEIPENQENEIHYPKHYSQKKIDSMGNKIKKGILYTSYSSSKGFISNGKEKIYIKNKIDMNRAINGDIVYYEEYEEDNKIKNINEEEVNDGIIEKLEDTTGALENKPVSVRIVKIESRVRTEFVGSVINNGNTFFVPLEKNIPWIKIHTSDFEYIKNKRIMVVLDEWKHKTKHPIGHIIKIIGERYKEDGLIDINTELESILLSNNIDYFRTYSFNEIYYKNVRRIIEESKLKSINSIKENLGDSIVNNYPDRYNFTDDIVFSIDPLGCTDIDDCLHIKRIGNDVEVGVHIADVSYFIHKDSYLDKKAFDKSTTIYLPSSRIEMLPTELSSDYCSLVENKERLTYSVVFKIANYQWEDINNKNIKNNDNIKVEYFVTKGIIKSNKSFTYEEAQNILDNKNINNKYYYLLLNLNKISKILKNKRMIDGALELSRDTYSIEVNKENNIALTKKIPIDTNSLIEEFMLLTNISISKFIYSYFPNESLLRRHPTLSEESLDELKNIFFSDNKINTIENNNSINSINNSIKHLLSNSDQSSLFKSLLTRTMNQATYFSSGSTSFNNYYHFGLAAKIYTHFTSPIRRYSDIIVHRICNNILYSINNSNDIISDINEKNIEIIKSEWFNLYDIKESNKIITPIYSNTDLNIIADHLNFRTSNSKRINRECNKLYFYLYSKNKIFNGKVLKINDNKVIILLTDHDIEGSIENNNHNLFDNIKVKVLDNDDTFFIDREIPLEEV